MSPLTKKLAATFVLSAAGLYGLLAEEGVRNHAYLDVANIPTICVGHTAGVKVGDTASDEVCRDLLKKDVHVAEVAVKAAVRVPVTQDQFDALVSLTFNIGADAVRNSTLVKKLNAKDCLGAAAEFSRWNKSRVRGVLQPVPGLTSRRARERSLFEKGCT
jgi:lysozyme